MTDRRSVLYVAAAAEDAIEGAAALERAGPSLSVTGTSDVDGIRDRVGSVDCVVFAETPTTVEGASLLEVLDACAGTPLVLFTEAAYTPAAARATDGIEGYVRRDAADAFAHLADEIGWVCHGRDRAGGDGLSRALALATEIGRASDGGEGAATAALERAVELAADVGGFERCWIATVDDGTATIPAASPAAEEGADGRLVGGVAADLVTADAAALIDDLEAEEFESDALEAADLDADARSLVSVPVEGIGAIQAVADAPNAFDEDDVALLESLATLASDALSRLADRAEERERRGAERTRLRAERDRLADERDRLADERERLAEEAEQLRTDRERLEAERDRLEALFERAPDPVLRYAVADGDAVVVDVNAAFEAAFGRDREAVRDEPVDAIVASSADGGRSARLAESIRAGEPCRLEGRRETVDGVGEFEVAVVPTRGADAVEDRAGATRDGDLEGVREPDSLEAEGMVVYRDVTEERRLERELAAATDRLESIGAIVDDEVREPLNVARGYLELAEETRDPEHFAEVDAAHESLREYLDHLAALAGRDAIVERRETVALHDVARRAWIAVDTGDARLRLGRDAAFEADVARLRELFEHLLRTAIDDGAAAGAEDEADAAGDEAKSEADDGESGTTVTVGATDDGFFVAGSGHPLADAAGNPLDGRTAAGDGNGFRLGLVERIARAHGWRVGVAEREDGTAFAFRGVDVREAE